MTVAEYNEWIRKCNGVYCFVNNINHALDKAGDEAVHQMACIGWGNETKQMLDEALRALVEKKRSEIEFKKSVLTKNIDDHPYTGIKCAGYLGELVAKKTDKELGITKGKKYKIVAKCGYGDVEDILFENDKEEVGHLGSWFFKEVEDE